MNSIYKQPDIIGFQETHLSSDKDPPCFNGYHPLVHKYRNNHRGGGVGLLINKNLSYSTNDTLTLFIERIFESIACDITVGMKRHTVISIYRPPSNPSMTDSQSLDLFFTNLADLLSKSPSNTYIILDSNINLSTTTALSDKYFDLFYSNGFLNHINTSSRITLSSCSMIDHIFSNNADYTGTSGVISVDISDHLPTFINIRLKNKLHKSNPNFKRFFSDENCSLFERSLASLNWNNVMNSNDTEVALSLFTDQWNFFFEQSFPLKKVNINRNKFPINQFFTRGLIVSRNRKNELYNIFLTIRDSLSKSNYMKYRNCYNRTVRLAKRLYYNDKIDKNADPKSSWRYLKEAIGKSQSVHNVINNIVVDDVSYSEPRSIADQFNNFFSEVADKIVSEIPPTSVDFNNFLPHDTPNTFEFRHVNTESVGEIVQSLESKTSLDINGVSTLLVKKCAAHILTPLTHILNLSLRDGIFPDSLKISRVCPIHKQGSRTELNNYRPISCLPVFSKIFEKIVYCQLFDFLTGNKIINPLQFGFQPGKSTTHPLIHILNFIANAFNNNKFVVAVFLDLRKAFDMVSHDILLRKLNKIGIGEISLNWFRSYLTNRKMFSMVNGQLSDTYRILTRSVPQGSILGPLLFLLFINDMPNSNMLLNFLFADDTTALTSGDDIVSTGNFVNLELQKLGIWLRANELAINTDKTKVMIFSNKKQISEFNFVFNNNDIGRNNPDLITKLERISNASSVPYFKMLGVYLDEHLTFDHHCLKITKKINSALYLINRAKHLLSKKSLKKLYFAMIHPHLLYCLPVYSFCRAKNISLLFKKQKQCIRIINKSKYNAHTEPLFYENNILPLHDLINHQIMLFMHSVAYKYSKVEFDSFIPNSLALNHRQGLRNDNDFHIPMSNLSIVIKMPLINFPRIWNDLDRSLKDISSRSLFKNHTKLELLDKYDNFRCNKTLCYSCMNI